MSNILIFKRKCTREEEISIKAFNEFAITEDELIAFNKLNPHYTGLSLIQGEKKDKPQRNFKVISNDLKKFKFQLIDGKKE